MTSFLFDSAHPVTLVGGGAATAADLDIARHLAPDVVAADGGAGLCLAAGHMPKAVIGDMDSLSDATAARIPNDHLHRISEQDSTDFDKALRSVRAPLYLGVGFLGKRVDHQFAALNRLLARPDKAVILLDAEDVVCHLPPRLTLATTADMRLSLFPMAEVWGMSTGLHWPIEGLPFHPAARVGTSNRTTGPVTLEMARPGMLLILPREALTLLAEALQRVALWPAPAQ